MLGQELKSIADVDGDSRVLVARRHVRQVLLGHSNDGLVDIAEGDSLDRLVLEDLSNDTSVSSSNNKDFLGVGVGVERQVGDHLLVTASQLDGMSTTELTRIHLARCIG